MQSCQTMPDIVSVVIIPVYAHAGMLIDRAACSDSTPRPTSCTCTMVSRRRILRCTAVQSVRTVRKSQQSRCLSEPDCG